MDSAEEEIGSPKTYITLETPKPKPPAEPQPPPPAPTSTLQNSSQIQPTTNNVTNNINNNVSTITAKMTGQRDEDRITKTMKQRYWHSWEELRLIELWRRYKSEVTDVRKSLPVFRKIVEGMRTFGFLITAQDCRRKINTLTNRYNNEKRNMRATKRKTDWHLYPLVDCIMEPDPKWTINDSWHECVIIKSLLDKVQSSHQPPQQRQQQQQQLNNTDMTKTPTRAPLQARESISNFRSMPLSEQYSYNNQRGCERRSTFLPIHHVTREKIAKLKLDNERLLQQRDDLIERLQMEEKNFKMFRIWTEQQQLLLNQLMP